MTKEKRFLFLTVLTFLMYGLGLFLDADFFILPFPLFDFVLLWAICRFAISHFKEIKLYQILFAFGVLFKLLTNEILISLILSKAQALSYAQTGIFDAFFLFAIVFWSASFTALVNIKNSAISIYWSLLHIVISVGILFTVPFWLMPLFSILPGLAIEINDPKISFKWLWYLKFALDLMTLAMLHLLN